MRSEVTGLFTRTQIAHLSECHEYLTLVAALLLCISLMMAEGSRSSNKKYVVRFDGNNSKRWDGKEVWLDPEILDELYDSSELYNGANISVPWKGKGGKISHWNAVFVDPNVPPQGR